MNRGHSCFQTAHQQFSLISDKNKGVENTIFGRCLLVVNVLFFLSSFVAFLTTESSSRGIRGISGGAMLASGNFDFFFF